MFSKVTAVGTDVNQIRVVVKDTATAKEEDLSQVREVEEKILVQNWEVLVVDHSLKTKL